ncbi:diacylglycerol/lipid kinase family protein [Lutibacter citreus]|uniref:diacylglycerol/lipid kinase family protein n=1 Tax=Lutibacter citreus TaxID=2138210 RepID=UPI000DBE7D21|nr:YegS/Rv2252/BmrU family lipid kinase [Lutibacter citreus]
MIDIHFIVNPIAGSGNHNFSETFFHNYFERDTYKVTVKSSKYKGHAIDLTKESINQEATIIVACGGDGTINEVASTLVGINIPMGIIPVGSGNGLASNLKIPQKINKAIEVVKNNVQTKIDVGCLNNHYFFSNTGFGFDASVIENYEASTKRTLYCYLKATLKSYKYFYNKKVVAIEIDEVETIFNPFLIFISNSNEMGYGISLTPKALLQDGLLDVVIVPKLNKVKMLFFGISMLFKKPDLLNNVRCYQTKNIKLYKKKGDFLQSQMDGEVLKIKDDFVAISLKEKSLLVIV